MMNVTDRHCRVFLRLLSGRMKLYTEMLVSDALIHGSDALIHGSGARIHGARARFLGFDHRERPLALQLAGSDPAQLALCAGFAEEAGYDEINLNVGCPSERVRNGHFGACLMAKPALVSRCVAAMRAALDAKKDTKKGAKTPIAVTVKTRIGIDHHDSYEYLAEFVERVSRGGCAHFIIHARKAWLRGLSPKENRLVPVLRYDRVYRLKRDFPDLCFTINGGIRTLKEALGHLQHVDGVMIGREASRNPWMLGAVDEVIFKQRRSQSALATRADAVAAYGPYVEQQLARGVHLRHLIRPMLGLYHGQPGARSWRRHLSEHGAKQGAGMEVIEQALKMVTAGVGDCARNAAGDDGNEEHEGNESNEFAPGGRQRQRQRARAPCPATP